MRRALLVTVLAGIFLGAGAGTAVAAKPVKTPLDFTTDPFDIEGICPFTIQSISTVTGQMIVFTDNDGRLTRQEVHATETDVFSANGRSLTTEPYTYNLHWIFDSSGTPTHIYATGLVLRVELPDGTTFQSAGRLDFVARNAGFAITPDVGHSGDVGAFCAALSG